MKNFYTELSGRCLHLSQAASSNAIQLQLTKPLITQMTFIFFSSRMTQYQHLDAHLFPSKHTLNSGLFGRNLLKA